MAKRGEGIVAARGEKFIILVSRSPRRSSPGSAGKPEKKMIPQICGDLSEPTQKKHDTVRGRQGKKKDSWLIKTDFLKREKLILWKGRSNKKTGTRFFRKFLRAFVKDSHRTLKESNFPAERKGAEQSGVMALSPSTTAEDGEFGASQLTTDGRSDDGWTSRR